MAVPEMVKPADSQSMKIPQPPAGRTPPSPAPTNMSFNQGDDRDVTRRSESTRSPTAIHFITREIERDTPATGGLSKKSSKGDFGRKKSAKGASYYGEVFAVRESGPVVPKSSAVWVELRTNVILENEFEFAKSLSEMVAKRFGKSEDAVCVSIEHSACLVMGGTYDGSFLLTITSLNMISPTCNKRNAALICDWISNNLGVEVARGYIRFVDPDFANYAMGGFTMLDLMEKEELARTGTADKAGVIRDRSIKRSMSRHRSTKKGRRSHEKQASPFLGTNGDLDVVEDDIPSELPSALARSSSDAPPAAAPAQRMKKRSMFDLFSRSKASR
ncbi:Tautomerase/MIF [Tuber magnatum]|uniref:L-dopachrome isomerase n=1 Tax=Tuber magnatum TaxID=42249 RepID=A0A317T1P1_9PEZI|nr:Tautomerase/MIF [Tuber magnatum]